MLSRVTGPSASLVSEMMDLPCAPTTWHSTPQRIHFEGLLDKAQQAQLRATIEAELGAASPETAWCRPAPGTGRPVSFHTARSEGDPVPADAATWSRLVRGPAHPSVKPGATFAKERT